MDILGFYQFISTHWNTYWEIIVPILAALGILTRISVPLAKLKNIRNKVKENIEIYKMAVDAGGPEGPKWSLEEKEKFIKSSGEVLLALDDVFGSWLVKIIRKIF